MGGLAVNAWLSLQNVDRLVEATVWVEHTHEVLRQLSDIMLNVVDAEANQRGYLLTGDEDYLQPYRESVERIDGQLPYI